VRAVSRLTALASWRDLPSADTYLVTAIIGCAVLLTVVGMIVKVILEPVAIRSDPAAAPSWGFMTTISPD
jgi:hypothetical protein